MASRAAGRALVVAHAFAHRLRAPGLTTPPAHPRRILVAHHLLLGDTLMLTPLLAKLRAAHPEADLAMLMDPAFVPIYAGRPYGVRALPFEPRSREGVQALLAESPFDLAVVPGDNRFSWIAAAMGARHVVAHGGDRPATKNWFVDAAHPMPSEPASWGELIAALVEGPEPAPYARGDWRAPPSRPFAKPEGRYAVLHLGASTALKHWPAERWRAVAQSLAQRGIAPVWSAGKREQDLVAAADPEGHHVSLAGQLDLAQLWHLVEGAAVLVAPDTGIAHLSRLTFTPTITLYGPGSKVLAGRGRFWQATRGIDLGTYPFECRDQAVLFRRKVDWVRRCGRSTAQCPAPRCMQAIGTPDVLAALDTLLEDRP